MRKKKSLHAYKGDSLKDKRSQPFLFQNGKLTVSSGMARTSDFWLRGSSHRKELGRLERLLYFERILWTRGVNFVAGVDEVGLGAVAGPVVAAAVIFPSNFDQRNFFGIDDSKKLTPTKRETLCGRILQNCAAVGMGIVEVGEIAKLNIYRAGQEAMRRAVLDLTVIPDHVLIDCRSIPDLEIPHNSFVKGDSLNFSIASASIVAKVHRDRLMVEYSKTYPEYGFAQHKGYGTEAHWEALKRHGICPIHRSFYEKLRGLHFHNEAVIDKEIMSVKL